MDVVNEATAWLPAVHHTGQAEPSQRKFSSSLYVLYDMILILLNITLIQATSFPKLLAVLSSACAVARTKAPRVRRLYINDYT